MILAVTGSRDGHPAVETELSRLARCTLVDVLVIDVLVTGDASGVDTQAVLWAIDNGVFFVSIGADWDKHGKGAGPRRNAAMVATLHHWRRVGHLVGCVGFPVGRSIGTQNCLSQMRGKDIACLEVSL